MKKIVEILYGVVKSYVMKQAQDTGNTEFINKCISAFKTIEEVWVAINETKK